MILPFQLSCFLDLDAIPVELEEQRSCQVGLNLSCYKLPTGSKDIPNAFGELPELSGFIRSRQLALEDGFSVASSSHV